MRAPSQVQPTGAKPAPNCTDDVTPTRSRLARAILRGVHEEGGWLASRDDDGLVVALAGLRFRLTIEAIDDLPFPARHDGTCGNITVDEFGDADTSGITLDVDDEIAAIVGAWEPGGIDPND